MSKGVQHGHQGETVLAALPEGARAETAVQDKLCGWDTHVSTRDVSTDHIAVREEPLDGPPNASNAIIVVAHP